MSKVRTNAAAKSENIRQLKASIDEAASYGRYLAVVYAMNGDDLQIVRRTTFNFPRNKFNEVVGSLAMELARDNMNSEMLSPPLPPPLPREECNASLQGDDNA